MSLPRLSRAATILIVDDDATNRLVASKMCELLGAHTASASSGAEAVAACAVRRFDVVLMDVRMPQMDGLTACKAIRTSPSSLEAPPVIAVTGDVTPDLADRCRAVGMSAVVEKPISLRALAEAIEDALVAEASAPSQRLHVGRA